MKNNKISSESKTKKIIGPLEYDIKYKFYSLIDPNSEKTGVENSREYFKKNGFLIVQDLYDPEKLHWEVPKERGQYNYYGSIDTFSFIPEELQVSGSLARYNHPYYKQIHTEIRLKLEHILGEKLYNTYYYDRFYFPGQELIRHRDRDACEVSVSIQISKTNKNPWPFCLNTLSGEEVSCDLENGWGLIYMGCEVEHWRDPLPSSFNKIEKIFNKIKNKSPEDYHHQIFFHYVRANGLRSHFSNDCK